VVAATTTGGLEQLFHTQHLNLTLSSTAIPNASRHYDTGRALRADLVDARVWLGIHFRFADVDSRNLGLRLSDWTLQHHFQPIDHD
jgi:hypothetical protein